MDNLVMLQLWKTHQKQLEESLQLNRKNTLDITKLKVQSLISEMKPMKILIILMGLAWIIFVDSMIITLYPVAGLVFLISAGIQVVLTKIALAFYLYQIILIKQIDIDQPVLETQKKLASLRSTSLWIVKILILQLPIWSTFFINQSMFDHPNLTLITLHFLVTLGFCLISAWLFININYKNRNKAWFKLLFQEKEWAPILKSLSLLEQIKEYE